jgi:NAD-dependent aldehyde dehydrogenases
MEMKTIHMKMLIDGEWVVSNDNEKLKKYNPVDGKLLGLFLAVKKVDIDRAVDAADRMF